MVNRGGKLATINVYVTCTEGAAKESYENTFMPNFSKYLGDHTIVYNVSSSKVKQNQRADTLAVSAVLSYPDHTMLHCSVLVEGKNSLNSKKKDFARVLADQIIELDR